MRKTVAFGLCVVAIIGGATLGRAVARIRTPQFKASSWPARGQGEELIEFYDPSCGASRLAHKKLAKYMHGVKHRLVLVALSQRDGRSLAERMCVLDPSSVFQVADRLQDPTDVALPSGPSYRSHAQCSRLLEISAKETGRLATGNEQDAVTPLFYFRGTAYVGIDGAARLEKKLEEVVLAGKGS